MSDLTKYQSFSIEGDRETEGKIEFTLCNFKDNTSLISIRCLNISIDIHTKTCELEKLKKEIAKFTKISKH